ncbi:hypothetical protein E2C01_014827 [Portunus trituberculatus]|uniref:Uncharacterized protein n=1 Tax=Portunus trituberculatus TaxID=210409 RepID=A0A5B7DK79_PORTR|nr:hypothetical protein [Portunus trituberculatus]
MQSPTQIKLQQGNSDGLDLKAHITQEGVGDEWLDAIPCFRAFSVLRKKRSLLFLLNGRWRRIDPACQNTKHSICLTLHLTQSTSSCAASFQSGSMLKLEVVLKSGRAVVVVVLMVVLAVVMLAVAVVVTVVVVGVRPAATLAVMEMVVVVVVGEGTSWRRLELAADVQSPCVYFTC